MTQTIKITRFANEGVEVKEVSPGEAKSIVEKATSEGRLVINKRIGEVIDELTPDIEEILIIEAAGGG